MPPEKSVHKLITMVFEDNNTEEINSETESIHIYLEIIVTKSKVERAEKCAVHKLTIINLILIIHTLI